MRGRRDTIEYAKYYLKRIGEATSKEIYDNLLLTGKLEWNLDTWKLGSILREEHQDFENIMKYSPYTKDRRNHWRLKHGWFKAIKKEKCVNQQC